MSKPEPVPEPPSGLALAALRPSEYTAALIQVLQANAGCVRGATVLEIGSGSGVVLAALGALGAASLCGIDIEEDAVASGMLLLDELGHGEAAEFHHGDMWLPVAGRRFDLIVANLPHFPDGSRAIARPPADLERRRRRRPRLLDPFLEGLGRPSGAGRPRRHHAQCLRRPRPLARDRSAGSGFALRSRSDDAGLHSRRQARAHDRRRAGAPRKAASIHRYGPYAFGEMHIVEIASTRGSIGG